MSDTLNEQYISTKNKLSQLLDKHKTNKELYIAGDLLIMSLEYNYERTESIARKNELIQILESTYTLIKNPNENNMAAYFKMADREDRFINNSILATCMVTIPIILLAITITLAIILNPLIVLAISFVIAFPIAFFGTKYAGGISHSLMYEQMHNVSIKLDEQIYERTRDSHTSAFSFFGGNSKMESLDESELVPSHPLNP